MSLRGTRSTGAAIFLAMMPFIFQPAIGAAAGGAGNALPTGLGAVRDGSETFTTADLLATSMRGMLDPSCGGYCIIGLCSHLKTGFSWRRGVYFYTIISPKLRHPVPDLLVSSYTHPGKEPYAEWRASFGAVISTAGDALGMAGGRPDPLRLDQHQSASFKEVDIIGHPLAIVPQILDRDGNLSPHGLPVLTSPVRFKAPDLSGPKVTVQLGGGLGGGGAGGAGGGGAGGAIDVKAMVRAALKDVVGMGMSAIMDKYEAALLALQAVGIVKDVKQLVEYFTSIKELMDVASLAAEVSARATLWANAINPRFRSPRLFCPNTIRPLQPYYLSFADAFWWRAGWPVTDGPFSGSDHSATILNPLGNDPLPVDANPLNPLAEVWGNLYPREGMLDQPHDAKTASVIAWRGMDVLQHSIPGRRVGMSLPSPPSARWSKVGDPKWQMVYPEVKSCQPTPYYPPNNLLASKDFMAPNISGGYAWNYYRTYTCCSNTSGKPLVSIDFPAPICITLGDVEKNAKGRIEQQARMEKLFGGDQ